MTTGPRRTSSRLQAWIAALFALLWFAPTAGAAVVQDIVLGDRLVAKNLSASGVNNVGVRFEAVAGTKVSIRVKATSGSWVTPTVVLKDAAGAEIDLGDRLIERSRYVKVRNFEILATGTYIFEIRAVSGSGEVRARTRGRFPKKYKLSESFPGPGVGFDVLAGSRLRAKVKAERGSGYEPTIESVTDDSGPLVLERNVARRSKARFRSAIATGGGTALLTVGGSGAGNYTAWVRVKTPRSKRTFDLTSLSSSFGAVSGTVTNSATAVGLAGATVSLDPPVSGVSIATDATGSYSEVLPAGSYTLTFESTNFTPGTQTVSVLANQAALADAALDPIANAVLDASTSGDNTPGGMMTATTPITILDGSATSSILWTQLSGPAVILSGEDTETATVTLPGASALKEALIAILEEPPIAEDDLPPNVELPEGGFVGGLQDRFQVVGTDPFSLEEAAIIVLQVEVTTSSGSYTDEVEIHAHLPYKTAAGIRNVPIGIPVILHGKDQATYDWALTGVPGGSGAALADAPTQNPEFTPDVAGLYTVEVTDITPFCDVDECSGGPDDENACTVDGDCSVQPVTLEVHAGTWRGVIVGQDGDGRPVADAACTGCHSPGGSIDQFTPWAQSGHAEIFGATASAAFPNPTSNLNTSTHYSSNCFSCHMVGFDTEVANGGVDDAADYGAFLGAGLFNNPGDNWTSMLASFPEAAQHANIQCENCHGPQSAAPGQDSSGHGGNFGSLPTGEPRVSIASEVCATCHGEPLRHARFQQWQLSGHANYEVAIDESGSGSCSRCHTANGFLAWLPILTGDVPGDPLDSVSVTWTADEAHPQTCVACHDPHNPGSTTGLGTDATVRISGDTPPLIAGFTAIGVGRGAICMTCHNSRRGLRNDDTYDDDIAGTSETARAPHGSSQADVLMGENAFLVETGIRGNHSFLTDSCVNCHMEQTPPPDLLAYNLGGTNHTFAASPDICSNCHGSAFDAEGVQSGVDANLDALQGAIEEAILTVMTEQIAAGNSIDLNGKAVIGDPADVTEIVFGEYHGRQAITVTLTGGATFGPLSIGDVDVVDPGAAVLGMLYDFADERLIKSGWNWNLIHNDSSRGIHNPSFALAALDAGIDALAELAAVP